MAYPFIEWAARVSPGWMRGRLGSAWTEVQAAVADVLLDAAKEAVKARFPALANADALPYIAAERSLEVYPAETESAFRARLRTAWDAWVWAGTHKGVIDALALIGDFTPTIAEYWDWPTPAAPTRWARFWVLVKQPHPYTAPPLVGDPGLVVGSSPPWLVGIAGIDSEGVKRIKRLILRWKAAHARCVSVIVVFSGVLVDGSWTVGDGTVIGGTAARIPVP